MMSLAWPLFRVTEQAALAAWPQTGCGDKNKIDGLAVTAMRQALNDVAFRGRVVIGEGERYPLQRYGRDGRRVGERYPTDGEWGADADITDRRRGPNV